MEVLIKDNFTIKLRIERIYNQKLNGQDKQLPDCLKVKHTFWPNEKKKSKTRRSENYYY